MKLLLDFFPILLFFVSYKLSDIYTATAVLMAATIAQMAVIYLRERSLQTMHKVTLVLVLGFGAMTLGLHDERFIKWKPTVLYCGMALALALATWVFKKSPIKGLLGSQLELPDPVWSRLNGAWVLYCTFMRWPMPTWRTTSQPKNGWTSNCGAIYSPWSLSWDRAFTSLATCRPAPTTRWHRE